jgi:hypothetical protein
MGDSPAQEEKIRKREAMQKRMGVWFEENCDPEYGDIPIALPDPTDEHTSPEDWVYGIVVHDDGTHTASRFRLEARFYINQEDFS